MSTDVASDHFDLLILGAGSGGYAAALRAAELGLTVALVEKDKLGGTCLHRGCIPTKALLHAAEVADGARDGAAIGVHASVEKIDASELRSYADGVVNRLHRGLTGLIAARGITVVSGEGRLVPTSGGVPAVPAVPAVRGVRGVPGVPGVPGVAGVPGVPGVPGVAVGERTLTGDALVLATGSAARTPPGVPVDGVRVLTSDHALRLDALPHSAIVLGGGVIGVEFASAWRSFGVDVTIVEALPRLLPTEEPAASAALARAYRRRGITMLTGSPVHDVTSDDSGVRVRLDGDRELSADVLLVAVGRGPAAEALHLDEHGIATDRGAVVVDERLGTSVRGVYAIGDLVPGPQLAHRGFAHGIFVAEEVAHRAGRLDAPPVPVDDLELPRVTYSDPEVASVGMTEEQARAAYEAVETFTYDLAGNGRSVILRTQGFVKVVRRTDGPVVGVHMVGARVGDLISEAQLITAWQAYPSDVATLIHPHPTQSEALGEAHLALAGKPLHVHG